MSGVPPSERKQQITALVSDWCQRWYDPSGQWISDGPHLDTRGTLWICFGLLDGAERDVRLANAILAGLKFELHVKPRSGEEVHAVFDIFVTNHVTQMLTLHAGKMDAVVREKLEGWARAGLATFAGNRQADYQFHGHNDNMPAKATLGMILGGEYFNDDAAIQHGLWNLRQLGEMLSRRGLISEYNSPTYTTLTILNLIEVANLSRTPEARALAAKCLERVWADVLGHFHPPTGMLGGPYSRAYQLDSTGHLSTMSLLLWTVFGDEVIPHVLDELKREKVRLVHHHGEHAHAVGLLGWVAAAGAEPPEYLVKWMRARKFPFTLRASAERAEGGTRYHAGEVGTTQYQEEDFSLGTADADSWSQLQAEVFFLRYRRVRPAKGVEEIRTAYLRYFINEEAPIDPMHAMPTHGNLHVLQDRGTALVLARPDLNLADKPVTRLKLSMILPIHFGKLESLEIRDGLILGQDGPIRFAIRPLNHGFWGGSESLRFEISDNYQLISLLNYEGPERTFTRDELGRTLNGFLFSIASGDAESAEAFESRMRSAKLVDFWHFSTRTTRCQLGDTRLEINYGLESDFVRFAAINGKLLQRPVWAAEGMPLERLPFLDGQGESHVMGIPFEHLRVVWAPEAPWLIAGDGRDGAARFAGKGWNPQ